MAHLRAWLLPLVVFVVAFLGLTAQFDIIRVPSVESKKKYDFPDFYKYRRVHTLNELTLDERDSRLIIVGDVHGMNESFHDLLSAVSYTPDRDSVILAGDLLVKTGVSSSLAMLDFLAHAPEHLYAVRGNHDQIVVEWRAWRDWFEAFEIKGRTGRQFLEQIETQWHDARKKGLGADEWVHMQRKFAAKTWRAEWWRRIPTPGKGRERKHWELFSEHYWLAKEMTKDHAQLMYDMPTLLHIPSEHMFVVHAGLLPYDLRRTPTDARQPLAHTPSLYASGDSFSDQETLTPWILHTSEEDLLRVFQEKALLSDIRQNHNNWVLQNMRGVHHGKVTSDNGEGTPWATLWNAQMARCVGFDDDVLGRGKLPCQPVSVVFGHAAARGLDLQRWSFGLDTGCMYGRRLTALVLQHDGERDYDDEAEEEQIAAADERKDDEHLETLPSSRIYESSNSHESEEDEGDETRKRKTWRKNVKFGDKGGDLRAELISIKCEAPDDTA